MDEQSTIDWIKDSQSFDTVAGLYDDYRPAYPQELVDRIIELSGLSDNCRILEIGSGTGKATRLFACRGYSIHCVEPGGNLAALAARNMQFYPQVSFEISRFEQSHEHSGEFDLVISAQAFHWVSKDIGYAKAARALKPGGSIALFWNMHLGFHGQIADDLDGIYKQVVPELESRSKNENEEIIQKRSDEINQSGCFGPVVIERFSWSQTYRTREYLGLLNTHSDHLRLSEGTRQLLFKTVAAAIDAQGGSIERDYLAVLYFAKKLS